VSGEAAERAGHYGSYYGNFAADAYAEIRRAEYGEDFGQNNWQTPAELEHFASLLALAPGVRLLDVACGSGGPALLLARATGCRVTGVDREAAGLRNARRLARNAGLDAQANFVRADASRPLPFADGSFDAVSCIDALNHLPGRPAVFADWARLLAPGGRLLFTDPVTVTGLVGAEELAVRSSIGYFDFAPPGEDERLLAAAGLTVVAVEDGTETMAGVARRRCVARAERAAALRQLEGDEDFERRQRFLDIVAILASERRISRFAFLAEKPATA
jgi:SAM-dependent methyltransferase